MTRLQIRVKGVRSMLDIDLPALDRRLRGLSHIDQVTAYDDRRSDATFVTFVLDTRAPAAALAQLQAAFGRRRRVAAYAVDEAGALTPLGTVTADELPRLDMRGWARFAETVTE